MAYTPTVWKDGDVISAALLNHMEQGINNEQVGPTGPEGPAGPGVATGGTAGQVLLKASGADNDTKWGDVIVGPLTQAQYDALTAKVSTVLYCIKE